VCHSVPVTLWFSGFKEEQRRYLLSRLSYKMKLYAEDVENCVAFVHGIMWYKGYLYRPLKKSSSCSLSLSVSLKQSGSRKEHGNQCTSDSAITRRS